MFRNLISRLDVATFEIIKSIGVSFILRAVGAVLAFLFNVAVGRLLGAEQTGYYFIALSLASIGAVVSKFGLDNSLLRFIAAGSAENDWSKVRKAFFYGISLSFAFSLFLSSIGVVFAPLIAKHVFQEPLLVDHIRIMSVAIICTAMMNLLAEALKGLGCISQSMLVSGVLYPLIALILIWPLIASFGQVGGVLSYALGTSVAAIVGAIFWRSKVAAQEVKENSSFSLKDLISSSRPLWVMAIVNRALLPWMPLFFLGTWGGAADSGVFGAATRVSMLVSFFLLSVNTVLAPKFSELYAVGEVALLNRIARKFTFLVTLAASPFLFILIFFGESVMSFFGEDFARGGTALAILAVGQAVNTATGSVGYILMMSGYEKDLRSTSILGLVVMLALSWLLIPRLGIIGAAISSAGASITISLTAAYFAWHRVGYSLIQLRPAKNV